MMVHTRKRFNTARFRAYLSRDVINDTQSNGAEITHAVVWGSMQCLCQVSLSLSAAAYSDDERAGIAKGVTEQEIAEL